MTLDPAYLRDPAHVRAQYASEENLQMRSSLYSDISGPFAGDVAFEVLVSRRPRKVLDVGCGPGWFGARVQRELGADVVAVDQSERMVELASGHGLDARVADVQDLPFADGEFDAVGAHWMLYHVTDVDRGVSEIARVLKPGGVLVAITNRRDHLTELFDAVGGADVRTSRELVFAAENGADVLAPHFSRVEMLDASGTVSIADRDAIVRYLASSDALRHLSVPQDITLPLVARRSNVVFVATK